MTRAQILKEIDFINANWPAAIKPEVALALLEGKVT